MIVIQYYQWRNAMEKTNPVVTCPDCNGEGITEDECPCCGQDVDSGVCGACEGEGKLLYSSVNNFQKSQFFTMREYLQATILDLVAWSEWTGKPLLDVATDAGFSLAYSIDKKKPYLVEVIARKGVAA